MKRPHAKGGVGYGYGHEAGVCAWCAYYEVIEVRMSLYTVGFLWHSVWPSNRNRVHTLRVMSAALSRNGTLLGCWLTGLGCVLSVLCKWKDDWQGMEGWVRATGEAGGD